MEKCQAASATTACPISGTTGTLYRRGTGSDTLNETDLGGNDQEEYLFFNGQRIARRDTTSTGTTIAIHYYFSDHLGTHGVVENATGTTCEQDIDYYPYGGVEEDYCSGSGVAQNYKFNGKERDGESGLDNFGARYDSSALGRFMTPDWAAKPVTVPYAKFGDPQTLNLYSFTENDPVNRIDPDGHLTIIVPGTWNKHKDWDKSGFKAQVSKKFGEQAIILDNDGMKNSKEARSAAAKQLEQLIKDHKFADGEKLNIVAHSHGGNVVAEATQEGIGAHKIDTLVTLGTPIRSDYTFNESVIGQHLNVYSNNDGVQRKGGQMIMVPSPMGMVPSEIPAERQINQAGARNLDATSTASSHSNLWEQPQTWDHVVSPEIK